MKRPVFTAIVIIVITIFVAYFVSSRSGSVVEVPPLAPTPTLLPSVYRGVNIETSSADSVISSLGTPLRISSYKEVTTYIYSSTNPNLNLSVEVNNNNSVRRIMEPTLPSFTYSSMVSSLGTPQLVLYGALEDLGFRLFIYPEKGTAVLANPETDEAKIRWYFPRMTRQIFVQTLGEGYSTSYDSRKQ